jgi:hypothetical protein
MPWNPRTGLVARQLERRWEEALAQQRQIQEDYDRYRAERPRDLSVSDRESIRALAQNIPALWTAPSTSNADRQIIVRHLIDRIEVDRRGRTEFLDVTVHWAGGSITQHEVVRSVTRYVHLRDWPRLEARILQLRDAGRTAKEIAQTLNAEGFRTPQRGKKYSAQMISKLASRFGMVGPRPHGQTQGTPLSDHEWWLTDLARELSIPWSTLAGWCRKGWVRGRQTANRWWIVWADEQECERLRLLRSSPRGPINAAYPPELKTPKSQART